MQYLPWKFILAFCDTFHGLEYLHIDDIVHEDNEARYNLLQEGLKTPYTMQYYLHHSHYALLYIYSTLLWMSCIFHHNSQSDDALKHENICIEA